MGMILKQLIENGNDGSLCPLRFGGLVFALLSTSCFFGLAIWTVVGLRTPLDYAGFGGGLAAVWGVVAAGVAVKARTEQKK